MEVVGYGLAVAGFAMFNVAKNRDMEEVRMQKGIREETLGKEGEGTITTPLLGDPFKEGDKNVHARQIFVVKLLVHNR